MFRIGICDDGEAICASIEKMVLKYAEREGILAVTEIWYSGESCCQYLQQGNAVDVLFLDILLLTLSGVEVADYIRNKQKNREMQIIFISSQNSFAMQLFKMQPLDFLIKPITQQQVDTVLNIAVEILNKDKQKFEFRTGNSFFSIPMGSILFFSSEARKVKIQTSAQVFSFYGKLRDVADGLPDNFILIHQSFVVNRSYVARFSYENVELLDGTVLPISKKHRRDVREYLRGE